MAKDAMFAVVAENCLAKTVDFSKPDDLETISSAELQSRNLF